ncbi:type II toxin-antitoxin system RelE/ParE family toxin [Salmonella enterica subsp. enterica]|uniref:Toxin n=1 Tax=Salmonella enterica subsp. enterica serovar Aqua TaxID=1302615 RepID=A0A5X6EQS8_SALET|nr:type II toxin-antitoxin system RelE/ParE family toxin [Salmonella enterica subsp. enterica serovar Aqua]ECH1171977.1 type II toxin-antitoxin system RelE/ParE family toxin [Salmonella enterica subsp. enterica serovar Aqua]HCM8928356.1 type II toxin-antitoxin system RelE/ParE family toxin [Salmonella enterica subsp. enterica serovar Paratyphi B]
MSKTYRLSPLAEADLEGIWLYTFQNWSITQADSYHRDLVATFEALVNGMKPGRPSVLPDYQKCLCGSHVVYFLDYPDRVDIIRILHQRQDADQYL